MLGDIINEITGKSSLGLLIFLIVVTLFICPGYLSGTGNPTSTPLPTVPPRIVGDKENFPWHEAWRKETHMTRYYQNVRNLVAVKDVVIFMNSSYGDWLTVAEAGNGALRWRVDVGGSIDSIVTDGNVVYTVGNPIQGVTARNLQTGDLVWKSNYILPGHRGYSLRLHNKHLYAYESRNLIYIFDPKTGDLIDKIQVPGIAEEFLLYLENDDWLLSKNKQVMLVKEGEIVWQMSLDGPPQKFPYVYDNMLIVRLDNDRSGFDGLAGLDFITGKVMWQRVDEFYSNFVIDNGLIYVVSKEAKILILDPKNGQTLGFAELLPNEVSIIHPVSAIAVNENMLYVYFIDNKELIAFKKVND